MTIDPFKPSKAILNMMRQTEKQVSAYREPMLQAHRQFAAMQPAFDHNKLKDMFALTEKAKISLPDHLFSKSFAAEMKHLNTSLVSFQRDPALSSAMSLLMGQISESNHHFARYRETITKTIEALKPNAKHFLKLAEEERIATFILELGFIPHSDLWGYIADVDQPSEDDLHTFSCELADGIWKEIKPHLEFGKRVILGDQKITTQYHEMMMAHEAGFYESAPSLSVSVIERSVRVVRQPNESSRAYNWLSEEVRNLPLRYVGGMRGYRVWKILLEETYGDCRNDEDADNNHYPKRHGSAHGIGARPATILDSLNAILLTHFVIQMVEAVQKYKKDRAA